MSSPPTVAVQRPPWSMRLTFTLVPNFPPSNPKSSIPRSPRGTGGSYRVTFVLAQPGKELFHAGLSYVEAMRRGDSLLLLPPGVRGVKVELFSDTGRVEVIFSVNSRGALATGQVRLIASNFAEAEKAASNLMLPLLSWWSYRYDIAIDLAGYEVVEENTDVMRYVFGLLGQEKTMRFSEEDSMVASTPQYRALFASYREGSNATNPFYQFLCYYRVTEGARKLRAQRRQTALAAGQKYFEPSEVVPGDLKTHSDVQEFFNPYLGRKFTWVLDQFRSVVRNAVAHLDPEADSLVADKFEDVAGCEKAIPVVKYIARVMLSNELAADFSIAPGTLLE